MFATIRTTSHDQDSNYYFLILGPFKCLFWKYSQLHYFIKWQQKSTLYRTLPLHIYGGGHIYSDRGVEKPGRSDDFPQGTGCKSCFFIMYLAIFGNLWEALAIIDLTGN